LLIPELPDEDQFELLLPEVPVLPPFMEVPELIELLVPVVPLLLDVLMLPDALPEFPLVLMLPFVPVVELFPEVPLVVEEPGDGLLPLDAVDEHALSVAVPVVLVASVPDV